MKAKCPTTTLRRAVLVGRYSLCVCAVYIGLSLPALGQAIYSSPYTITTLAGGFATGSQDGVGSSARFNLPAGVAVDNAGNILVSDSHNYTIRKITPAGVVSTLAGFAGSSGTNDGTGRMARFNGPQGLAVDSAENVYVADGSIRLITPAGVVKTLASGLGGAAGVAADSTGNVYVAAYGSHTICEVTPSGTNWTVSIIAGVAGNSGSADGTGSVARFNGPSDVALDGAGNLYVADCLNNTIRKMTPSGTNWAVTTLAGLAGHGGTVDGTNNSARFNGPAGLAVDSVGNIFVAEQQSGTIREVSPSGTNWVVTTLAGSPGNQNFADGTNSTARLNYPLGVAVNGYGDLYVADLGNNAIRQVASSGTNWVVTTFAGLAGRTEDQNYGVADGTNGAAQFDLPQAVAVDTNSNVYVADLANSTIRKVTPDGVVTTLAGLAGVPGNADGTNSTARFNSPYAVAVDGSGNVYVADSGNSSIRLVTPAGVVTTLASGINDPAGVALDGGGNVYFAALGSCTICQLMQVGTNWTVTTLAGASGSFGTNDGVGSDAQFSGPQGIAVDTAGNIYVADTGNVAIRKMVLAGTNWTVTTIAGQPGSAGYADGTNATALFSRPTSVAVDGAGNIYVADLVNNVIRKVAPVETNWVVTTIAGGSLPGANTESVDGTGSQAIFDFVYFIGGVAADSAGNIYVADGGNNLIRKGYPTASSPMPVLQRPCLSAGQFGFGISGVQNLAVDVQSSSDLTNWQFVGSYVLVNGSNCFVSPDAPQGSQFYRVHVR